MCGVGKILLHTGGHTLNYSQLIAACRNDGIPCEENAALAPYTSMKIGGACDLLVKTADEKQLLTVLRLCRSENIPHFILGRGSNLLVSSAGWRGAVILLSGEKPEVEARGNSLTAWAGVPLYALCSAALEHSLTGLEFAYGIPGSLGGALYMNAGAYGGEMKDVVTSCRYVGGDGEIHEMSAAEMQLTYRHSVFSGSSMVITSVTMELVPGDKAEIIPYGGAYAAPPRQAAAELPELRKHVQASGWVLCSRAHRGVRSEGIHHRRSAGQRKAQRFCYQPRPRYV